MTRPMTRPLTHPTLLLRLAELVPPTDADGVNAIVGIDGVDGAGKTRLAQALTEHLLSTRRAAVHVSIDGFHARREQRYRRGRDAPEGFWRDSYDYESFRREVIAPFRAGEGTYLPAAHDVETDAVLTQPRLPAPRGTVLFVDGIFLHRPELRDIWDVSVFLDVPFRESARRMGPRDGLPLDPDAPENARYVGGQRLYLDECRPAERATVLVDYADFDRPRIVRVGHPAQS